MLVAWIPEISIADLKRERTQVCNSGAKNMKDFVRAGTPATSSPSRVARGDDGLRSYRNNRSTMAMW